MASISNSEYSRINIYLDDPDLRTQVKIAAARRGITISAFCVEAIRRSLEEVSSEDEAVQRETAESPRSAAQALDKLRRSVGRIGVPVSELIAEGRK